MEMMNQKMDVDFLCHHGTKGQKWGIRNYQNPDGSLTEKGRKHWGIGPPRDNSFRLETKEERAERLEKKRQKKEAYEAKKAARKELREQKKAEKEEKKAAKEEQKRQEEAERITKMKIDLINKGDKEAIYKNRDKFTDDELKYAMQRIELQNKFNTKDKRAPFEGPSSKEAKEEQKALAKAEKENKKKINLINKGDMDEIYKNRAMFTDEELQYAMQRIELQNKFDKKGMGSGKIEVVGSTDAKKEAIAKRADPKEVYQNRAMFTDDELSSLVKRIENTQKIKNMDPEEKKAAEALKQNQQNKQTVKDGKSTVDKINDGVKTAVTIGGTLVSAYQMYNKIASAANELNPNGAKLPTFDMNPWSRKDSDKDKKADDNKNDNQQQSKKGKQKNQNQNQPSQQKAAPSSSTQSSTKNQNSSKYDVDANNWFKGSYWTGNNLSSMTEQKPSSGLDIGSGEWNKKLTLKDKYNLGANTYSTQQKAQDFASSTVGNKRTQQRGLLEASLMSEWGNADKHPDQNYAMTVVENELRKYDSQTDKMTKAAKNGYTVLKGMSNVNKNIFNTQYSSTPITEISVNQFVPRYEWQIQPSAKEK